VEDKVEQQKSVVLITGNWREGADDYIMVFVKDAQERKERGLRQLSYEATVSALTDLLDGYDEFARAMLEPYKSKPTPAKPTQSK